MDCDIIGDIHGHCDKLDALLGVMGYRQTAGPWWHPERTAIFVGDCAARAVMGNQELNAIAWHTRDPRQPDE